MSDAGDIRKQLFKLIFILTGLDELSATVKGLESTVPFRLVS